MEFPDHVPSTDYLSKPGGNLAAQKSLGRSGNNMARGFQSMRPQDKLKLETRGISNADFHHEITESSEQFSHQLAWDPQKQRIGVNEVDEDELVKYMSSVPSYLQKGEALKEKALNVGVLDWGLLEKWRYSQKPMPYRSNGYSPSSSNTSSSFSTDESSTHSSRGRSCSPTRQRMRRPSLRSHLSPSLMEGPSQVAESSGERKFQAIKSTQSGSLNRSENSINAASPLSKKHADVEMRESWYDAPVPNRERNPGSGALRNGQNTRASTFNMTKTETEMRGVEDETREEKVQEPNLEHISSNGNKRIVLLLPKGVPESSNSAGPRNSDFTTLATRKSRVYQRSFTDGCQKACHSGVTSDVPHSCPLSSVFGSKKPQVESLSFGGLTAVSINCPSASSKSASQLGSNLSRGILESKKEIGRPVSSTSTEHSKASEEKPKKTTAEKVRSISPFYRLTSSVSRMSKSSGLNDSSDVNNQRSTDTPGKSGREYPRPSSCDSSSTTGRARSSPLRRLLDPLLKPKAENSHHSAEPSERVSAPTDKACKSVDGQHVSFAARSGKVKLGMNGCRKISVNELAMGKKHGPSTVQALFRVAAKNGLPLYTFAVNNENNILAATVKIFDTRKNDGGGRIYTFFAIQDLKKKKNGGWINQGGRGNGQDYVSNVVAQMKLSDCGYSDLGTQSIGVRGFVLFSVDLRQAKDQTSEFQAKDELAAILVRYPKETSPISVKDEPVESTSWTDSKECLAGKAQRHKGFRDQDSISTTVIFPSAVHSLPSKGGPSSLIERWISGGSCDCGGWDLGCKLQILTNLEVSSSSKSGNPSMDRFELFPQGGLQENQQVFSLTPFKDGIYSTEFHSSISVLQAFSICTAVLDT